MPESQMTLEKAFAILERIATKLDSSTVLTVDPNELLEAIKTVKAAAQKQIAIIPKPDTRYYGNGICPSCRAVFLDKSTNYCGQKLDWEITE